ncbi:taurine catabolism dioxygenase [Collybia nuda]|uniref:Taurine catabolism dioxygenase n=1 Tax=Collybia nuda TaxID=64659 RepID=A0A9P6CPE9_9AGAR|nr:taurine catabolism dioxygenase [Collybia nuda]
MACNGDKSLRDGVQRTCRIVTVPTDRQSLQYSHTMVAAPKSFLGSLSAFESYDTTVHIGTTFPNKSLQLSKLLTAPNSDELIKDLATLVSHRGVVFLTDQDIAIEQQKELGTRLGELSGKPATSKLHKHPISEDTPELGADVSVITSTGGISRPEAHMTSVRASKGWHTDITFEPVPSDYAILKMHTLPSVGGDTLWASGYEAYDRLSPVYQKFLEGLTAVHHADSFIDYAKRFNVKMQDPRGSPENTGTHLTAIHPVIRTNPVTGFKSLFVNQEFTKRIVELSPDESRDVLNFLSQHISENHDFQVRYRWKTNDIAIWDNRATFHTATNDYGEELRQGNRVVSIGEKPFLDPLSKSRREALGIPFNVVPGL